MKNNQPDLFEDLRNADADRALLSYFAPLAVRENIQVLDLWNAEIARIRDDVREPHMGLIRLQWWRDEISRICDGGRSDIHPVLRLLSEVISKYDLPFSGFDRVLRGREFEFENRSAVSWDELLAYIDETHGVLMVMKCRILDCPNDRVSELSRLYSVVGLVRSLPYFAQNGRVIFPELDLKDVRPHAENLIDLVRTVCCNVDVPYDRLLCRYLRATRILAELYLKQIEKAGYDPFHIQPVPFKEFRLWFKSF
ncbi:MAG TPA: squalene/phytoene synthase family protein [Alphaproteobacteria bacterium]|jgi:phytoene/squalene synthetase|nr:squalene/phytoene synthase family protein [Alphaproteobacteria bacterium]MCB9985058.1 squalene/phytoene synthase family protein [Micavibrio sp.]HPQ50798.1 squalene/phytoene synthase family protein [Alphaproteobacteria bacterium]HRK97440.1 squalene/phytoene synthase family protein [Alphaproteobacteria bacterium]